MGLKRERAGRAGIASVSSIPFLSFSIFSSAAAAVSGEIKIVGRKLLRALVVRVSAKEC